MKLRLNLIFLLTIYVNIWGMSPIESLNGLEIKLRFFNSIYEKQKEARLSEIKKLIDESPPLAIKEAYNRLTDLEKNYKTASAKLIPVQLHLIEDAFFRHTEDLIKRNEDLKETDDIINIIIHRDFLNRLHSLFDNIFAYRPEVFSFDPIKFKEDYSKKITEQAARIDKLVKAIKKDYEKKLALVVQVIEQRTSHYNKAVEVLEDLEKSKYLLFGVDGRLRVIIPHFKSETDYLIFNGNEIIKKGSDDKKDMESLNMAISNLIGNWQRLKSLYTKNANLLILYSNFFRGIDIEIDDRINQLTKIKNSIEKMIKELKEDPRKKHAKEVKEELDALKLALTNHYQAMKELDKLEKNISKENLASLEAKLIIIRDLLNQRIEEIIKDKTILKADDWTVNNWYQFDIQPLLKAFGLYFKLLPQARDRLKGVSDLLKFTDFTEEINKRVLALQTFMDEVQKARQDPRKKHAKEVQEELEDLKLYLNNHFMAMNELRKLEKNISKEYLASLEAKLIIIKDLLNQKTEDILKDKAKILNSGDFALNHWLKFPIPDLLNSFQLYIKLLPQARDRLKGISDLPDFTGVINKRILELQTFVKELEKARQDRQPSLENAKKMADELSIKNEAYDKKDKEIRAIALKRDKALGKERDTLDNDLNKLRKEYDTLREEIVSIGSTLAKILPELIPNIVKTKNEDLGNQIKQILNQIKYVDADLKSKFISDSELRQITEDLAPLSQGSMDQQIADILGVLYPYQGPGGLYQPFEILDLDPAVVYTEKEINKAYKKRMLQFHPDRHAGEEKLYEAVSKVVGQARDQIKKNFGY